MQRLLRANIAAVAQYRTIDPIEVLAAQRGLSVDRIIRLNANENPYGTPLRVQEALASFDQYHLYPDPESREVRRLLAAYTGMDAGRILVGNGSDEIIDLLFWLFVSAGDAVIIPTPTFGMYQARAEVFGATARNVPRRPDFSLDIDAIEAALSPETKLIFLASPNNPSGNLCRERDIIRLLRHEIIVVVDEAYFEFSGRTVVPLIREFHNLVVLRTFSKWAGLAGLRIGYGILPSWMADAAWRVKQPYNVNVAAQVAVQAVFEEMPYFRATIRRIRLERLRMYRALRKLNFVKPLESKANYLLVRVTYGGGAALQEWLEEDGIFIRRYSSPDLADYVRISVGRPEDTDRLMRRMTALAQRYAQEM